MCALWQRSLVQTLEQSHLGGRKSSGSSTSTSVSDSKKKGNWEDVIPDGIQSIPSSIVQIGLFAIFWISIEALLPKCLCLIQLIATISSLKVDSPPLFCDFKYFNIKAAAVHCPVIQEESRSF